MYGSGLHVPLFEHGSFPQVWFFKGITGVNVGITAVEETMTVDLDGETLVVELWKKLVNLDNIMDEGEDSSCDADVSKELAKMAAVTGVGCTEEVCVTVDVANTVGEDEDSNNCDDDEEDGDGDDDDRDDEDKDEGKDGDHNGEEDEDEKLDKGEGNDNRDEGKEDVDDDDHVECAGKSFVTWEVNNLNKLADVEV